jgi:hypothetical protein
LTVANVNGGYITVVSSGTFIRMPEVFAAGTGISIDQYGEIIDVTDAGTYLITYTINISVNFAINAGVYINGAVYTPSIIRVDPATLGQNPYATTVLATLPAATRIYLAFFNGSGDVALYYHGSAATLSIVRIA